MLKKIFVMLLLMLPGVLAFDVTYDIIVEDNGNSLVIMDINGTGLLNIPVYEDLEELKIKGALYKMNNNSIDISIGSTNHAILLYKTSALTKKDVTKWELSMNLINNTKTTVYLPGNVQILDTKPSAFIENSNFTKILFDNSNSILIEYKFNEQEDVIEEPVISKNYNIIFFVAGLIVILSIIGAVLKFKPVKNSRKEDVLKTLSKNEKLIINILLENKGSLKRSLLEKQSKIAKSSLANTLSILERKNILTIDKTYTSHFVKLERWFDEL